MASLYSPATMGPYCAPVCLACRIKRFVEQSIYLHNPLVTAPDVYVLHGLECLGALCGLMVQAAEVRVAHSPNSVHLVDHKLAVHAAVQTTLGMSAGDLQSTDQRHILSLIVGRPADAAGIALEFTSHLVYNEYTDRARSRISPTSTVAVQPQIGCTISRCVSSFVDHTPYLMCWLRGIPLWTIALHQASGPSHVRAIAQLARSAAHRTISAAMETEQYALIIDASLDPCPTFPALVWAEGIAPPIEASPLPRELERVIADAQRIGEDYIPAEMRTRVRTMLRHGRYKPTGRGKPASEYLLRTAIQGAFPQVTPPVDVNNWVSLESGYPASVFDAELSGSTLLLRRGKQNEAYVFNQAGQTLDLYDLLIICRRDGAQWEPCGSPVKDAMATKISRNTRHVVAVLYAPPDESQKTVRMWAERFAARLADHCQARSTGWLLPD